MVKTIKTESLVRQCDRCGKEIPIDNDFTAVSIISKPENGYCELCDECAEKLKSFLNREVVIGNTTIVKEA